MSVLRFQTIALLLAGLCFVETTFSQIKPPAALAKNRRAFDAYGDPLPEGAVQRLGTTRFRTGGMTTLVLSLDGKHIAASGTSRWAFVWDVKTGKRIQSFEAPKHMGIVLFFSPDGKRLFTQMSHVSVWDVKTGKRIKIIEGGSTGIHGCALSPDGKNMAIGQAKQIGKSKDGTILVQSWIEVIDAKTEKLIRKFGESKPYGIRKLVYVDNGKSLLSFHDYDDRTEMIRWNPATGKERSRRIFKPRLSLSQLSRDHKTLAFYSRGLEVWDLDSSKRLRIDVKFSWSPDQYSLSPDGKMIVFTLAGQSITAGWQTFVTRKSKYICYDVRKNKIIRPLKGPPDSGPMLMLPDGKTLLTTSVDGVINKWDTSTGKPLPPLGGHVGGVRAAVWLADGKRIASISSDGTMRIWNARTGKELRRIDGIDAHSLRFMPGLLIAGTWDARRFVETKSANFVHDFAVKDDVNAAAASAKTLAMITSPKRPPWGGPPLNVPQKLQLWDLASRKRIAVKPLPFRAGRMLAVSPKGDHIAAVRVVRDFPPGVLPAPGAAPGYSHTLVLWNIKTGRVVREFPAGRDAYTFLKFLNNGKTLVSGTYKGRVQIWDTATGKEIRRIKHKKPDSYNFFTDVSSDGKLIATSDHLGETILLWKAKTGKLLRKIRGHRAGVLTVAFSPDSRFLLSGSYDTTMLIWDLQKVLAERNCGIVPLCSMDKSVVAMGHNPLFHSSLFPEPKSGITITTAQARR